MIETADLYAIPKQQTASKFTTETQNLMKERRNFKAPKTAREKIEKPELDKLISKKQRRSHNTKLIEHTIGQGRGFKTAKKKRNIGRTQMSGIKEQDGSVTKCRERIIERTREFYQSLYTSNKEINQPEDNIRTIFNNIPSITATEIHHAIKQMK